MGHNVCWGGWTTGKTLLPHPWNPFFSLSRWGPSPPPLFDLDQPPPPRPPLQPGDAKYHRYRYFENGAAGLGGGGGAASIHAVHVAAPALGLPGRPDRAAAVAALARAYASVLAQVGKGARWRVFSFFLGAGSGGDGGTLESFLGEGRSLYAAIYFSKIPVEDPPRGDFACAPALLTAPAPLPRVGAQALESGRGLLRVPLLVGHGAAGARAERDGCVRPPPRCRRRRPTPPRLVLILILSY